MGTRAGSTSQRGYKWTFRQTCELYIFALPGRVWMPMGVPCCAPPDPAPLALRHPTSG